MFRFPDRSDAVLARVSQGLAVLTGSVVLLILVLLLRESWPAVTRLGLAGFFTDPAWHPSAGQHNLVPMLAGSGLVALGALLLAVPLGLGSAVFTASYAPPRLAWIWQRAVELMAGIPSVVYGFWGLVVLVPLIRTLAPPGQSLLAGVLVLTLMILPTVAVTAQAALGAVPKTLLDAGRALGLGRVSLITRIAMPAAARGLHVGTLLALGRALGETLAVLMVAGNVVQVPASLFDPFRALTANIALEMAYATDQHRAALFFSGLILFVLTSALILLSHRLQQEARHALTG